MNRAPGQTPALLLSQKGAVPLGEVVVELVTAVGVRGREVGAVRQLEGQDRRGMASMQPLQLGHGLNLPSLCAEATWVSAEDELLFRGKCVGGILVLLGVPDLEPEFRGKSPRSCVHGVNRCSAQASYVGRCSGYARTAGGQDSSARPGRRWGTPCGSGAVMGSGDWHACHARR
jgi:hypothetical protein